MMRLFLAVSLVAGGLVMNVRAADFVAPSDLPEVRELPDVFLRLDGSRVTSGDEWGSRRAELGDLFQRGMYGRLPPAPGKMAARVVRVDTNCFGGAATLQEVELSFAGPACRPLHLLMVTPRPLREPVPAFLCINFNGNQAVLADPLIRLSTNWVSGVGNTKGIVGNRVTEAGRGAEVADWNVERIIQRGFGFVTFHCADIEPDRPEAAEGVRALFPNHDFGAVGAWAWGFHRAMDYLVTNTNIAKGRIAAVGWSRNGKAALLAAALDERIAMVFPHQAGCGGSAPSRHWIGEGAGAKVETIERINTSFPHWFNADFKNFAKEPERLPFDQHGLVAMCAPRPVCFTTASGDVWSNPAGQFEVLKAASKVYELLGAGKLEAETMPLPGLPSLKGTLGFAHRLGSHSLSTQDWTVFLEFAERHLGKK